MYSTLHGRVVVVVVVDFTKLIVVVFVDFRDAGCFHCLLLLRQHKNIIQYKESKLIQ